MLRIEKRFVSKMLAHASEENPNECCGILAGIGDLVTHLYRISNAVRSPVRYMMDSHEQLEAILDSDKNGWDMVAFYHSHTHSPAYPSATDIRMALQSGWIDISYVVISLENPADSDVRIFNINEDGLVKEHEIEVI